MRKFLAVIAGFAVLALQGCATSDAMLEVKQPMETVAAGPLSDVEQRQFQVLPLVDEREDKERVGYKRNTYGMKTADIATASPVTEVVAEAISQALTVNGHALAGDGVAISGAVKRFWTESDVNFTNIELLSYIDVLLKFTDTATGEVFHERTYSGHGSVKASIVTEKRYTESLVAAVSNLVEDLVMDEDLAEALSDLD